MDPKLDQKLVAYAAAEESKYIFDTRAIKDLLTIQEKNVMKYILYVDRVGQEMRNVLG